MCILKMTIKETKTIRFFDSENINAIKRFIVNNSERIFQYLNGKDVLLTNEEVLLVSFIKNKETTKEIGLQTIKAIYSFIKTNNIQDKTIKSLLMKCFEMFFLKAIEKQQLIVVERK